MICPNYIAFYGSLKRNKHTPVHSAIQKFLSYKGTCIIPGRLYHLGRIPALKPGALPIKGELYVIKDYQILSILDQYEAIDNSDPSLPGFSRSSIILLKPKTMAWVYYFDGIVDEKKLILSNSWG